MYDKTEHLPVATVSNKAYVADVVNVSTYSVDTTQTDVGNYTRSVTAISGANASNYTMTGAVNVTLNWSITPKAATVTVNNAEIEYGSSKPAFTYNVSGLITGDELSGDVTYSTEYNNAVAEYRSAKNYDVTVSGLSNDNYDVTFVKGTLSVRKKAVVLVWDQNSYEYDKTEHLPVATLDNKGFGSDNVTLIYNTNVAQVNVGNYTRTVTGFGGAQGGNYTVTGGSNLSLNWTITPKEVGLDWQVLSASQLVYTGTAKTVTATATGLEAGDVCSVTTVLNTGDNVNVGNFTFKATALGNSNYKLPADVVSGSYAITKASRAAVVVEIEGWKVGDSANDPQVVSEIEESASTTVTYRYGVQGSADEPTVTVPTEAGDYYVIAVLSASDNYFGATSDPCQFSIE